MTTTPGETDLGTILAELTVSRRPGAYVFVPLPAGHVADVDVPILIREAEGTTVIVATEVARERGWEVGLELAWLTIDVHTSLAAVGVTAAVSRVLADASIPCNVVAGFHHDHLFIPLDQVDTALGRIASLRGGVGHGRVTRTETKGPRMSVVGPVLDAPDAVGLARFYERLLGWEIVELEGPRPGHPPEDGWAKLRSPDGMQKIEIQWESRYVPPTWPPRDGEQQMMIHLDIGVEGLEAGVEWAVGAGAVIADHQPQEGVRVMLDPAGHPFCLFEDSFAG